MKHYLPTEIEMIDYVQRYILDRKGKKVKINNWSNLDLKVLHFHQFEYLKHMDLLSNAYIIAKSYYED